MSFFDERSDESEVKARIVEKYFHAWANVVLPTAKLRGGKIAYVDLYAGPGRYRDGAASTPLLILQKAIDSPAIASSLIVMLNDADSNKVSTLQSEIDKLPGIEKLAHRPIVTCGEVGSDAANYFEKTRLIPTFTFVDPFGYAGFSLQLINGVIKDWGCDCVFFFNYNRINAGINNPAVDRHMNALFGEERAAKLRSSLQSKSAPMREALILEALAAEIKALGGNFVLPFTFKNPKGTRTTHKLVFVSKHFKGYDIMKQIMSKESSTSEEGVPSLTYSPADADAPLLFSLNRRRDSLKADLIARYRGRSVTMRALYEEHSVDTPFIRPNYTHVLGELETEKQIAVTSSKPRKAGTFADHVTIAFVGQHGSELAH